MVLLRRPALLPYFSFLTLAYHFPYLIISFLTGFIWAYGCPMILKASIILCMLAYVPPPCHISCFIELIFRIASAVSLFYTLIRGGGRLLGLDVVRYSGVTVAFVP
ncbi:hypothetical protein BJX76DRAFT_299745 [Aspergillus varians]